MVGSERVCGTSGAAVSVGDRLPLRAAGFGAATARGTVGSSVAAVRLTELAELAEARVARRRGDLPVSVLGCCLRATMTHPIELEITYSRSWLCHDPQLAVALCMPDDSQDFRAWRRAAPQSE
jgi:hypothetical protein